VIGVEALTPASDVAPVVEVVLGVAGVLWAGVL
jgi:hypothetical protein